MSVQTEINARTAKLQAILAAANQRITAKNGTAAAKLSGLPTAIDSIPTAAEPNLQIKGVIPTGAPITVRPDSGYDGLSAVNVAGDSNLTAENIVKDVTIYGVTGTFEGGNAIPEPYASYIAEAEEVYNGYAIYNGVELPNIDSVWTDKETYPYAYATAGVKDGDTYCILYLTSVACFVDNTSFFLAEGTIYAQYMLIDGQYLLIDENNEPIVNNVGQLLSDFPVTWVSSDITNITDNSVYLAASDPVALDSYTNVIYAEGYGEDTGVMYHTVMFLLDSWAISAYDAATTEYTHSGFYMVQKEDEGEWTLTDYTSTTADEHYAKNIKAASLYIEYNGMTLFPVGINNYPDTVAIDYSNWDNGSFSETLETGDKLEYAVEFDADGRPTKITAPDGTVTAITWEASE